MKWLGRKNVAFKSITMDVADIRARSKTAHVSDLANNIREHGGEPIHDPTVRMPGGRLLCGRDRMAALMVLKAKKVWVRVAECSDEEAADLEASENLHRRNDDRDEVIARAVRAKEALLSARQGGTNVPTSGTASTKAPPAPQTVKAEARRQVARDAGITTGAVKKAEQRAAAKDSAAGGTSIPAHSEPAAAAVDPALSPPTLNLLGCDDNGTRAVCKFARPTQDAIDEADKHLRLALGALKRIELTQLGQELRAQVERVGSLVRSSRPEFICPWCRGLPHATLLPHIDRGICPGCKGQHWVTAEVAGRAPRELREEALVALNGVFHPYADVRDGKLPAKNGHTKKPARSIAVVDEAGTDLLAQAMAEEERELTVERDEDEAY